MEDPRVLISVVALCVSSAGALCAITGVIFTAIATSRAGKAERRADGAEARAKEAEKRAVRAEERVEEQRRYALWGDVINGLQELVSNHAMTPEVPTKLQNLRIAIMELADGMPENEYPKLDEYLMRVHGVTSLLYDRSISTMSGMSSAADVFQAHEPVLQWLMACINNLRLMRQTRPGPELSKLIEEVIENGTDYYERLQRQRNDGAWDGASE